jgi:hypothetical protein
MAKHRINAGQCLGHDQAANDAFAVVGLKPVDAHIVGRQLVPDRQQEAGDDVKGAFGEFRNAGAFRFPKRGKFLGRRAAPVRALELLEIENVARHRPDEADAGFDAAVIVHQAGVRCLHGGALRLLVDDKARAGLPGERQSFIERQRTIAVLLQHAVAARFRAGFGMRVNGAPFGDPEAFGRQRLDPGVVSAGSNRRLDARVVQLLEGGEEGVLQIDAQRQHAVEKLRDRRQILAQRTVRIGEIEAGRDLELLE